MGRFRFSMQNILQMKEKLETQAKTNMHRQMPDCYRSRKNWKFCKTGCGPMMNFLKGELQESLTIVKIKKIKQDSEILETYIEVQNNVIVRGEAEVEQARKN